MDMLDMNISSSSDGPFLKRYYVTSFKEGVNMVTAQITGVLFTKYTDGGGAVASWLERSTPERALRVRALAGDIVLCSWARHGASLTVPLSTQVFKWVPANLILGVTLR